MILDEFTRINLAVKIVLERPVHERFAPIVVSCAGEPLRIIDMNVLLSRQCDLMASLYTKVQRLAVLDPLTNVSNRRGFFEAAQIHLGRTQRDEFILAALMVDIDNFKVVNDIYGHFVGDCVLKAVAEEMQMTVRSTDLFGRYGGEEFVVLFPNTSLEVAGQVAERIRRRIENLVVKVEDFQVTVTVSIGLSLLKDTSEGLDSLLTKADEAMVVAKMTEKNRVVTWKLGLTHKTCVPQTGCVEVLDTQTGQCKLQVAVDENRLYDETIEAWAHALELRDKEIGGHAQRVTQMALSLAQAAGLQKEELVHFWRGALMHDIGKIAIPDGILFKPGELNEEEWMVMRKHPVYALELLRPFSFLKNSLDIPYCHHERWDGSGYPQGLRGNAIPFAARIFSIIDVWDALSTDRCYRRSWEASEVREYLRSQSGKMFDPDLLELFFDLLAKQPDLIRE